MHYVYYKEHKSPVKREGIETRPQQPLPQNHTPAAIER